MANLAAQKQQGIMHSIKELQTLIKNHIQEIEFAGDPQELYHPIKYMVELGGKRMRPVLVMLACEAMGGKAKEALEPSIGIELFHNFTLLHDDIMDNAPLRRGKPTVHTLYNTNTAILAGDVTFVIAYQYVSKVRHEILHDVMTIFNETAIKVCEGQQMDMIFEQQQEVSIDQYIKMISLKTAALLGCSLELGAIIGGASKTVADQLYQLGLNLGISFQLQDDILDAYGDPEKFGKKVGGDIVQNKKTFLLLKALEWADDVQKQQLEHILSTNNVDDQKKIDAVTTIYNDLKIKEEASRVRDEYFERAMEILNKIDIPVSRKEILSNLANNLLKREV